MWGELVSVEGMELDMTMFQNGLSQVEKLKPGSKVFVMPTSNKLKVKGEGEGVSGSIVKVGSRGNVRALTVKIDQARKVSSRQASRGFDW